MSTASKAFPWRALRSESGQALPWMAFMSALVIGMAGLTLDLGRAYVAYNELQFSTDAAALAGAYNMALSTATVSTVNAAVMNYSSANTGLNYLASLGNVTVTPTLKCLSSVASQGILCTDSTTGDNAIQVTQSVSVPMYFIQAFSLFGVSNAKSLTVSATSTAAMRGAINAQYNVAIVVDTTASMGSSDSDASCGKTRIYCALAGVQTLLTSLSPCTASSTSTSCTAFDTASLFTFPNVEASTATDDTTCPTSNPTIVPYYLPTPGATWSAPTGTSATYQITNYLSDYSANNKANGGLNTSSALAIASGASTVKNCSGMQTPGGDGTYYAGVIYAAQSSLIAAQNANPGSLNAMIILSDGDADSSKICATWSTKTPTTCATYASSNGTTYGSSIDQCQQAITAAKYAAANGTAVYTIAYGAASSGCASDTSGALKGISPCTAMLDMASSPANFYSDATASQNKGQCVSAANPSLSLTGIFKQVATSFTQARLVPNNAT